MVCKECKKELKDNPMYREIGLVLICNHKDKEKKENERKRKARTKIN